jgi:hypothetical protein
VTTLRWGTRGMFANAIVESADETEETDKHYVDQGDGVHATRFLIKQGKSYTFTVVDDSAVFTGVGTNPVSGTNVAITEMLASGTNVVRAYGTVITDNYNASKGAEGKRVIHVENMVLIDSQAAPSVPGY